MMHDHWIAVNAVLFGKIVAINEGLVLYRQHDTNAIGSKNRGIRHHLHALTSRYELHKYRKSAENYLQTLDYLLDQKLGLKQAFEIRRRADLVRAILGVVSSSRWGIFLSSLCGLVVSARYLAMRETWAILYYTAARAINLGEENI
jgi:hypothetical protein